MSLYKRGTTWWICFATPNGEVIRRSAGTQDERQAKEFHDRLKAEMWRIKQLGEKPKYTWDDAALRWLNETKHKDDHAGDITKVRWLTTRFRGLPLEALTRDAVKAVTDEKAEEASGATANRYRSLISAILNAAHKEWEWLEQAPYLFKYAEAKRRIRTLSKEQVAQLMSYLPEHQREVVTFALATGLRQENVLFLTWDRVDLERSVCWIEDTKNDQPLGVALNSVAQAVLMRQRGKDGARVFTYRGKPLNSANTRAWRKALAKAGITQFRWHDLRHVWASWCVQSGVPLFALQEMGGWKSVSMVRRYAHLAPEHLASQAARLEGHFTITAHQGDLAP